MLAKVHTGMNRTDIKTRKIEIKTQEKSLVYVRYRDHVIFHRAQPESLKPQLRECVGWLIYNCAEYIVLAWDRDAGPPALRGGDPKSSGLVILCSEIVEMKHIAEAS